MFQTQHFIWIGVCLFLIISISILLIKFKCPMKYVLYTVTAISFLDKIVTFIFYSVPTIGVPGIDPNGRHLPIDMLPLHLCSIQCFFFLFIILTKNEKLKNWILTFTTVCMLMGAPFAILLPAYKMTFIDVVSYQIAFTHTAYIIYAIYMIASKRLFIDLKILIQNLALFFFLAFIAICINSAAIDCGAYANFFFTMQPPAPNLPYLNLNQGWAMYVFKLALLTVILITAFHAPYIIKDYLKKKNEAKMEDEKSSTIS